MEQSDEPDEPTVECPSCGTWYVVHRVEKTISPEGRPEFWCPLDDCPDHPVDVDENLVGTWMLDGLEDADAD